MSRRPSGPPSPSLEAVGLHDVVRDHWPDKRVFTYWDYRAGMFHQDLGMRIDLVLAGGAVPGRVKAAWVDRQARKGTGPSDHAPVIVDLDEAPDGDIGPVVPPPSNPVIKRGAKKLPQATLTRSTHPTFQAIIAGNVGRNPVGLLSAGRSRSREGWTRFGSPGILG